MSSPKSAIFVSVELELDSSFTYARSRQNLIPLILSGGFRPSFWWSDKNLISAWMNCASFLRVVLAWFQYLTTWSGNWGCAMLLMRLVIALLSWAGLILNLHLTCSSQDAFCPKLEATGCFGWFFFIHTQAHHCIQIYNFPGFPARNFFKAGLEPVQLWRYSGLFQMSSLELKPNLCFF